MIRIIKSSDSFLISNRKSKSSSEAVQNKERNYRQSRGGSVLVLQGKAKVLLCFVSSFLKQKIWKSINNFIKKIADPDDGLFCRQRQNMPAFPVPVPNVVSAWGKARHFLSTGQPLLRWVPGKQREDKQHHNEAGRRGCLTGEMAGVEGLLRDCGCWKLWQKSSPGKF